MPPIAYLTDHYPATSHTFVQREVIALRERGVDVRTFSIHAVGAEHVLSRRDAEEFRTTDALLPATPLQVLGAHAAALLRHPRAYLATVADAARMPASTPRARIWQAFYLAEAILLWRRCRRDGIRHVHAHFASPGADVAHLFGRFARRAGRRGGGWSFSAHGTDITDADPGVLAAKIRDADLVVCVSDHGRAQLMVLVGEEHWPKLHVVHCGIDLADFASAAPERAADGQVRLLAVGRLVAVKGHGVLIEAVARLAAEGVDAIATIVGDGPRRAALEALARELGVAGRVRFAGRVGQDDIRRFYAEADVFCLPSFAEGVPVVLMEAMAAGVPVVASRISGIPELVDDGVTGVLVPPGRPDRLAGAVRALAADPAGRERLAAAGRERIEAEFEVRASARILHGLLERYGALDGAAPAAGAARAA
jgi:colanic acid/amylovoran biosynthesis glycosyltransferase